MEGIHSSSNNSRVSKMKGLKDGIFAMDKHLIVGRNRYNLDMDSSIIRYFRSGSPVSSAVSGENFSSPDISSSANKCQYSHSCGSGGGGSFGGSRVVSPLSAVENIERLPTPVYCTPLKVEEEVMVMDGILVESLPGGSSNRSGSDSGGSSSSGKSLYKTEICRSWEESGNCRYGFKCQFAHGKEELRSTHVLVRNKPEANICKSYTSTGSCIYGSKCRFMHQAVTPPTAGTKGAMVTNHTASPAKTEHISKIPTVAATITSKDWSPCDDNIDITLPSSTQKAPSREDIDKHIHSILYGSTTTRFSVCAEICHE